MMRYKNLDTGEIWSEDEVRKSFEMFADEINYNTFEDYLDHLLELGRNKEGGLVEEGDLV